MLASILGALPRSSKIANADGELGTSTEKNLMEGGTTILRDIALAKEGLSGRNLKR